MILGYKSNYDRRLWGKTIASVLIISVFFLAFIYLFLGFITIYMEWLSYFLNLMAESKNLPPSVMKEFEKIGDGELDAIYWIGSNVSVLLVMFVGGIYFVIHTGSSYTFTIANWVNKKLNLIPMMRLSFKKVNPSRIDPLIKWLNKHGN